MPQHLTAAHSVCRKNYIVDKNGVAGAEPPYRSSAISATASCSGFVWLTASILAWSRGGSPSNIAPARMSGVYAARLCRTQSPQSVLIGIENSLYLIKTDFFYKLKHPDKTGCFTYIFSLINSEIKRYTFSLWTSCSML